MDRTSHKKVKVENGTKTGHIQNYKASLFSLHSVSESDFPAIFIKLFRPSGVIKKIMNFGHFLFVKPLTSNKSFRLNTPKLKRWAIVV